jgi:hypothetical protein
MPASLPPRGGRIPDLQPRPESRSTLQSIEPASAATTGARGLTPEGKLEQLRTLIDTGRYRVDSAAVAREMLRKASLIRRARIELAAGAGADRSRSVGERLRPETE